MKNPPNIPPNPQKEEEVNPFLDQKDIKNKDTIVIQIGSHSIKFGLASQYQPFLIPNVIAHKIKPDVSSNINIELDNLTFNDDFISCVNDIENNIIQKENLYFYEISACGLVLDILHQIAGLNIEKFT